MSPTNKARCRGFLASLLGLCLALGSLPVAQAQARLPEAKLFYIEVLHVSAVTTRQGVTTVTACPARYYQPDTDKLLPSDGDFYEYPESFYLKDMGDARNYRLATGASLDWQSVNEQRDGELLPLHDVQALRQQVARGYVAWQASVVGGEIRSMKSLPLRIRDVYQIGKLLYDRFDRSIQVQRYQLIEAPGMEDMHYDAPAEQQVRRLPIDRRARIGVEYYYWQFQNADYCGYDIERLAEALGNSKRLAELEIGSHGVICSLYVIYEP